MLNRAAPTPTVQRNPRLALALAGLAAGLIACSGGPPAASPAIPTSSASGAPPTSPLPTDGPAPSSSPIATPVSTTAPPSPSPATGGIEHPTGATDVVLRMDQGGGHMVFGFALTQAPTFTLYGDGTFLLRPIEDPERTEFSQGFPRFLQGRMTEEYVQALLGHALGAGRLLDARDHYPQNTCADCGSTLFTINAGGVAKTVTVDALGMAEETGPDAAHRQGFARLAQTITDLEARARSGELGEIVLYDPDLYRVFLFEAFGDPVQPPAEWAWSDVTLDDFEAAGEFDPPSLVMTRENVAMLIEVPSGGHPGVWVEDPDGRMWQLGVRPLLPDEAASDLPADG